MLDLLGGDKGIVNMKLCIRDIDGVMRIGLNDSPSWSMQLKTCPAILSRRKTTEICNYVQQIIGA